MIAREAAACSPHVFRSGGAQGVERDLRGAIVFGKTPARASRAFAEFDGPRPERDHVGVLDAAQHVFARDDRATAHAPAFADAHAGGKRGEFAVRKGGVIFAQKRGELRGEQTAFALHRGELRGRAGIEIRAGGEVDRDIHFRAATRGAEMRAEAAGQEFSGAHGGGDLMREAEPPGVVERGNFDGVERENKRGALEAIGGRAIRGESGERGEGGVAGGIHDGTRGEPGATAREDSWGPAPARRGGWRERLGEAERFKDHFYQNARIGIDSLSGPQPRPGSAAFALEHFTVEETARLTERASGITRGLFSLAWFLAVTMRAHRAVFQKRGAEPESYQASCAVQERKGGARHPIWQNRVSQLFFCLRRDEAAGLESAARLLHEQFTTLSHTRMPQAFATMTGLFRRMPTSWYLRFIRGNSGGHITSFFYSHTGQFLPECAHFAGAKIEDGWHIPSVSAPPGSGIFFSERGGRLTATISWREGIVREEEIAVMRAALREDLLGP